MEPFIKKGIALKLLIPFIKMDLFLSRKGSNSRELAKDTSMRL